jgi:two-component system LytT family response regulator
MPQNFFIRSNGKYIRINTADILFIKSRKNYVSIVTTTKTYLVLMSLQQLEKELPATHFCRVHRSYIISVNYISSFDHKNVYLSDTMIPIDPVYKNALQAKVKVLVSETRVSRC